MRHSRMILTLLRLLPFNSGASVRLRSHVERCERCQRDLATAEESRTATLGKPTLPGTADFWPRLASELRSESRAGGESRLALRRRWVFAAAGVLIIALAGLLFILSPQRRAPVGPLVKLRVDSVTIYGQPAQAFVFQTRDADSTFVWVERQSPD